MILCIIQARMGSTRLPGKILEKIDDEKKIIDFVVEQLKNSKKIKKIIVAIPNLNKDDVSYKYLISKNICVFRGSPDNVLDRYYKCAKKENYPIIVRITADNPLIDPEIVDRVIEKFESGDFDYVANTHPRTFPYGTEVEVFSFKGLERIWNQADTDFDKEHVTPYFYNHPEKFRLGNVAQQIDESNFSWTVDYKENLEFVKEIVKKTTKRPILKNDVLEILRKNPEILKINKNHT